MLWSCSLLGQDHIQFKSYTINDGLSQSYISTIVQDELGALWVGTQDGINRFNGKNFDVFNSDKGFEISNDYIISSVKDDHSIWFGTYDGLVKYDLRSEIFKSYRIDNKRVEIRSITFDKNNELFVGTAFGNLYKLNESISKLERLNDVTFNSAITDIGFYGGKLHILTEYSGLYIEEEKGKFNRVPIQKNNQFKLENIVFNKMLEDPKGNLLILTNQGIYKYDKKESLIKSHKSKKSWKKLSKSNIVDVLFLNPDRYFVATESNGLFQVNTNNDSLVTFNYTSDFLQKNTLLSDRINSLYQDKKGVIWVASQRGLNSFDPYNIGIRGVGYSTNLEKGIPTQNVWGFDEDSSGRYLFIAGDHGTTRFDKSTHKYQHFYRKTNQLEDYTTLGVHVLSSNRLLLASFDGVHELIIDENDPEKYKFIKIKQKPATKKGFEKVYTIVPHHKENTFLIGTKAGIAILDLKSRSYQYLVHDKENPKKLGAGPIRLIFKNDKNEYFASPSSGGIYKIFENENNQFDSKRAEQFSTLDSITNDYFTCALQSGPSEYWFGTMGSGMYYINTKTQKGKQFSRSNGLPNNVVYGIQKTIGEEIYWLSTNRGVVKFDRKSGRFSNYSEADGLMSDELNQGASFRSKSGEIYFGGIQGFNYFDPSLPLTRTSDLNVYFSRIEIENERVKPGENSLLEKSVSFTNKITLPYQSRSFNLYFFADDLSSPERIEYKYKLSGDDNIKEELGNINQLRFASLASGRYKLEVYAKNYNSDWNEHPAVLEIIVEKPFWFTWWFYLSIGSLLSLIIYFKVKQSIEKERRQQVKLELKIAERTKEIRSKSEEIERQKKRLETQKHELEKEKEKSERLLNNLLPKETASQLKNDGTSTARDFALVSVMFTDLVGFTRVAEDMSAKKLVSILDRFFRKFDEIIEEHDLEKIKTIGDAYMCAGGVPIRNKTNPIMTVLAALKIQDFMAQEKSKALEKNEYFWRLRIGINTGPVSAGVIGSKKYAYDVWGKTVNRAQRMEQMCDPEKIAITEETFEHIEPYFECKPRGTVEAKGGLKIKMYEVISIKPELSIDGKGIEPNDSFDKLVTLHFFSKINYYKAERFILAKLKKELSPKLHYHSYDHSKDVTRQAERIAIAEGITDEDLFLLKTAATYHDAGFVEQYDKNEPVGARMAEEILPKFGYTKAHIERIKELIYVTQIPHQPKNKLEEIMCDADLDYLGRDDFHEIADKLRRELREHGKIDSDRKWDEIQVSFLTQHRYFTPTAIKTRRANKMKNLEDIKKRLEEDNYKD